MSTLNVNNINEVGGVDAIVTSGVLDSGSLPAGSILQVVSATYGTEETTTSSSFVDTPLSLTITPSSSSSKIFLTGTVNTRGSRFSGNSSGMAAAIDRDGTVLVVESGLVFYGTDSPADRLLETPINLVAIDSPATTSAVTYTWQHKNADSETTISFRRDTEAFLIAMEVAA